MSTLAKIAAKLDRLSAQVAALVERADQPELLTPRQAAAALSVCTKTVRRMVALGKLRAVPMGKRWRVPMSEVRRLAAPKSGAPPKRRRPGHYDARAEAEAILRANGGGH